MSEGTLLSRLPRQVTPRKLAYAGVTLHGLVGAEHLDRLSDAVDGVGEVTASLEFSLNDEGKLVANGWIEADIAHKCQRCMQTMPSKRERAEVAVGIVRSEEEAKQLPKYLDPWIVPEDDADLYSHIEEELLLALPVVVYHDYDCIDESLLSSGDDSVSEVEEEKVSPFSVLSALKPTNGSDGK